MQSVLSRLSAADVVHDPFPHLVVPNAIDEETCLALLAEYPSLDAFNLDGSSNQREDRSAHEVVGNDAYTPLWQEFIQRHSSAEFLAELTNIFGEAIRREYPHLEDKLGRLETLRAGVRHQDDFAAHDILLDAQISVNTPVTAAPTSVRRAHLDAPNKLFAGLFYLRDPQDDSTGGDLQISRYRGKRRALNGPYAYDRFIEVVDTVSYALGTLVLFLNTDHSLHGVTVRSRTQHPRRFVNLIAAVEEPLFDTASIQASTWDKVLAGREIAAKRIPALGGATA